MMRFHRGALVLTCVVTAGVLGAAPVAADDHTCVDLIAGQDTVVGEVCVAEDGSGRTVTYNTHDGWFLTETHLDVEESEEDFPQTKKGNPKVGHFEFSGDHGPTESYTYDIDDEPGDHFAAHAVVEKIDTSVEVEAANRFATGFGSTTQGTTKGGNPVAADRSHPNNALVPDSQTETNFYSLGFGGYVVIEFDCAVPNLDGDDLRIWEVTGGTYPAETADVEVWDPHAEQWVLLGEANNLPNPVPDRLTESTFDLGDVRYTSMVRITDTTDPAPHADDADGFDLDGVESLQPCHPILEESAWGEGERFTRRGNWAMYFVLTEEE